jgi:hypothetical protein
VTSAITLYDDDRFTAPVVVLADVTVSLMVANLVRVPDLPVMVTVYVPAEADGDTDNLTLAVAGVAPPLNDPTTPLGKPEMLAVTVLLKPFSGVKLRVLEPVAPFWTVSAAGAADNAKVGAGAMVSATAVLLVTLPEVPVIVTVAVDAAAVSDAVKVTAPWPAVTALKFAITPAGKPEAPSVTLPLKPFAALMAMVPVLLPPGMTLTLAGFAASVKLAGTATVSSMLVLLVTLPDVPVTVTVVVPAAAFALTFKVIVVVCVDDAGLNVAVTPAGKAVTEKATVPSKLPCGDTVIVLTPLPPGATLRLAGDAAIA